MWKGLCVSDYSDLSYTDGILKCVAGNVFLKSHYLLKEQKFRQIFICEVELKLKVYLVKEIERVDCFDNAKIRYGSRLGKSRQV